MYELLRLSRQFDAQDRFQPGLTRRRADGALQLRRPQAVKEAAIHGSAVQDSEMVPP